ncbi:MAG: fadR 1 [Firmicutes bacterium]|nr:fadR 1 [Bacillota bacterium]
MHQTAIEGQCLDDSKSKRQQILKAAYDVFSRKGYHRATVDEIIALADTGKGTVYNYFNNKEQLFYTLIQERGEPFALALEKIASSNLSPAAKIEDIIRLSLAFYIENVDLWRVFIHEVRGLSESNQSNFTPEMLERYKNGFQHIAGSVENVLSEGVEQGLFHPMNITHVAYSLFSTIMMMVYHKFVDTDMELTVRNIANLFFHGIMRQ